MIRLNNISIKFKSNLVIENSELIIHRGRVTALTGPSGSGKTTLLYCVGLISSQSGHSYEFDNAKIDLKSDREKAAYRKQRIGYIFQDNNLIETMTVRDNLLTSLSMSGEDVHTNKADALLSSVGLINKGNLYPRQLSGGEKQRAAIACALIKNPDLIIADEPTSALDKKNADIVFDLLYKIAHEQNKMVVIATHDPNIYGRADNIFSIEYKKIHSHKAEDFTGTAQNEKKLSIVKLPIGFYFKYLRSNSHRNQLRKRLITLFCALAVSFISFCVDFGQNFVAGQEKLMNQISDREIFVVHATGTEKERQAKYSPNNLSFDSSLYHKVGNVLGADKVIPYIEIQGNKIDNQELFFYVIPYYPDQLMDLKSGILDETTPQSEGIYLSNRLARELKLDQLDHQELTLSLSIPTKLKKADDDDFEQIFTELDTLTVPIRGILEGQIENNYSNSGMSFICMPYETIQKLLKKHEPTSFEKDEKKWAPSACWVISYSYSEVTDVKTRIRKLDHNILAYNKYQDFESMINSIQDTRLVMLIISIAILMIVVLMVTVIRIHETERRKYEVCILKANGMTHREVYRLILTESLWETAKIFIVSFGFTCLLAIFTNFILFHQALILINGKLLSVLFGASLLSIVSPSIATILFTNRYEPDRVMRN